MSGELLSLFCGPGGLDRGFNDAGFSARIAIDVHRDSIRTFGHNNPDSIALVSDVRSIKLEDLDVLAGQEFHPVGVIGGPPCQSFSVSNVHQSDDDPRHGLPESYASLLKKLNERNPLSFFVFENVPGLLGKKHAHRYEKFKTLFEDAGFELYENLLDAQDFGVPQERKRIIIVGVNRVLHSESTWKPPVPIGNYPKTVRDAIWGLPEPIRNGTSIDPEFFPVHPNHWCLVPRSDKFGKDGALVEGQAWGRSFRTLAWDKPSWTVAYGHREVHVHPNGRRRLSIYEAMLLQSLPKSYRLLGNMSSQIKQVSEAVPPLLAKAVAMAIRNSLGI